MRLANLMGLGRLQSIELAAGVRDIRTARRWREAETRTEIAALLDTVLGALGQLPVQR